METRLIMIKNFNSCELKFLIEYQYNPRHTANGGLLKKSMLVF